MHGSTRAPCTAPILGFVPALKRQGVPPGTSLSNEAIYRIAAQIRAAVRRRPASDILRRECELPWPDEERVIAAAAVLDLLERLPAGR